MEKTNREFTKDELTKIVSSLIQKEKLENSNMEKLVNKRQASKFRNQKGIIYKMTH